MAEERAGDVAKRIADLLQRVAAFHRDNDATDVLDQQVLTRARELFELARTASGGTPVEVARVLAWLHWSRYQALPAGTGEGDLREALRLFAALGQVDGRLVPEALRRDLNRLRPTPDAGADPEQWTREAFRIMRRSSRSQADLDRAVGLLRRALEATPEGELVRPARKANLATALAARFEHSGEMTDLHEAIEYRRAAVAETPPGALFVSLTRTSTKITMKRLG
ncbi:MAG: hypothetical protein ABR608_03655 [Pseudonocardiaceae bacterium]